MMGHFKHKLLLTQAHGRIRSGGAPAGRVGTDSEGVRDEVRASSRRGWDGSKASSGQVREEFAKGSGQNFGMQKISR